MTLSGNSYYQGLGWLDGWCLNPDLNITGDGSSYAATIYSSYELNLLPGGLVLTKGNLDLVNWVLNQDYTSGSTFNYGEVQSAIWVLMGFPKYITGQDIVADGPVSSADVDAIVLAANSHDGFVPDNNQYIGVVLDLGSARQPIITKVHPASLGDYVWEDKNTNGIQDDGNTGINGVTVNLWRDLNSNGIFDGGNELLATTSTHQNGGVDGYYEFKGLTPGLDYQVQFTAPAGMLFTSQNVGDDTQDSDVSPTGLSQIVTLTAGEHNPTIDAGVVLQSASLGDRLWVDSNANGQQDDGTTGISGKTVTLIGGGTDGKIDGVGDTTATTTTGADGFYQFKGLTPGVEYQVQFSDLPAGYLFTSQNVGNDASDSDADTTTGKTQIVTLAPGEYNPTLDAGVVIPLASLGDRLWVDSNANGQQDDGTTGISGKTVTLIGGGTDGKIDGVGDTTATTTTGADGFYQFKGLTPGVEYQVQFSDLPAGYLFTSQNVGNDASDSDADTTTGKTQIVTLAPGEYNPTLDAGVVIPLASLGDRLWVDSNANGQQDDGTTGISGKTVTLIGGGTDGKIDGVGDTTATTTTGADGFYQFKGLTPGVEYQVQFSDLPAGYLFTSQNVGNDASDSDADTTTGKTQIVTLAPGEYNPTLDAGVVIPPASLGDRLWVDSNANGQQDDGTTGISGKTVTLIGGGTDGKIDGVGDTTATTTTGADGFYQFKGLTPGVEYQVQFSDLPAGYLFTSQNVGNDASDSDADTTTGKTQIVTLAPGEYNPTLDAGVVIPLASLGDRLWVDSNANGQQDDGTTGISGKTVTLIGGGTDGKIDGVGDTTATTTTGADGFYQFKGLTPGVEYQVQFSDLPAGYLFTSQNVGNDASDSDADTTTGKTQIVTLAPGEYNPTLDAGVVIPPASLGDRLWVDSNANGQQDDGTTGISGKTVTLIGGGTDGKIDGVGDTTATTTTGADGFYQFKGLTPGVEYQVQFSDLPAGYLFTSQNVGNDASDSDADTTTGKTQIVTLAPGEYNPTLDAGVVIPPASLGDRLWVDSNANGQQDDGTTGISGKTVTLIGGGTDGKIDGVGDTTATTTTGTDGFYQFKGLTPGVEYQVQFSDLPAGYLFTSQNVGNDASDSDADTTTGKTQIVTLAPGEYNPTLDAGVVIPLASLGDRLWVDSNGDGQQNDGATGITGQTITLIGGGTDGKIDGVGDTTATTTTGADGFYQFKGLTPGVEYQVQFSDLPAGYLFTSQNVGNDASDSDADTTTGKTQIVTLAPGEYNPTLDAGVVIPLASLGDRLWVDSNGDGQQNDGATGITGQTITLIGGGADGKIATSGDNTTATTTTGADGFYKFTGLTPGVEYQVQFSKPAGYNYTGQDLGGDDTKDSDVSPTGLSQIVTLTAGEHNPTIDAGLVTPKIDIEKTTNGPSNSNSTVPDYDNEDAANGAGVPILTPGTNVTWTYQVTNTGSATFEKNAVAIVDDNGTTNTADDLSVANGKITFQSVQTGDADTLLEPGEVWLYQATGTVQNLTTAGAATTFDFSGSSATDGSDGNVRTFTSGALSVKTSAFSRDQSTGAWAQAYLGSYGGGLGVTDSSESGSGDTHTVDNMGGRDNYVLFEFNQNVVVDSAFLGYVVGDSDLSVWIGTRSDPFNNHDTLLSDADLTALGFTEVNLTDLSTTRLADLNAGNLSGNVLVIAGWTGDTTPEDRFKIEKLTVQPVSGVYENKATVTAPGAPSDSDLSHYKNPVAPTPTPKIDIEKTTNGPSNSNSTAPNYDNEDAANGAGVPILTPGSSVTWTYQVSNTGNVAFAKSAVAIVDDNGTTASTADDLSVANGKITYQSGDSNANNQLDPNEVWLYKATGIVQDLTTAGAATTFDFSGSSATDGSDGNVRTFTSGALSVKTSAFSRDQSTGAWAQAYLGSYGGGLGVTDSSESGSGDTHTVDNMGGRDNYVLFEFNQNVVVDSAFLGYVVGDSDMSVWIGTRNDPFNNHDTMLSDAELTALGFTEVNLTDLSTTRLADLNAGNLSGNVLVIAGWTGDTTPEDRFKIEKLTVRQSSSGVYENKATVTVPGASSDSDLSHYKNPAAQPVLASLGDRVWEDLNANGVQDTGEKGISGVTVKLLNSSDGTVATTTTDANGNYLFSNLTPGDYKVQVVAPTGYYVSPKDQSGNDATDSDIDPATGKTVLTTLINGENDLSWDAGLYRKASVGDKVWEDKNHNFIQDSGEPGIGGIKVKLIGAGADGVFGNGDDPAVRTTTTNSSGNYSFTNLDPGKYKLEFDKGNIMYNGVNMNTWYWAGKDQGTNDAIDSDIGTSGVRTLVNISQTDAFSLVSNQYDPTRDAGITPIVIDLDGNGIQTVSRAASGGSFDLFGNGSAVASGWISGGDGFLAVDKNGNGKVDSISELFGGTAKGAGFAQLTEYDSNGDGLVNAGDTAFADLRIWRDINGNHQTDDGELMTLAEAGVSQLVTAYTELPFLDRQGNVHLERSSATMSDGQTVDMTDVYFNVSAEDAAAAGVTLTGIAELLNAAGSQTSVDAGWLFA
ncbi:SdrD B-like domain-containing protein [Candidatus Accumulibacter contiguus]|uniref:SdrD B-like domain-containing protein n=1 Tax=Candidatus Accumulibacter contiguus TaxID=2954381 RepID=UPI002FC3A222